MALVRRGSPVEVVLISAGEFQLQPIFVQWPEEGPCRQFFEKSASGEDLRRTAMTMIFFFPRKYPAAVRALPIPPTRFLAATAAFYDRAGLTVA